MPPSLRRSFHALLASSGFGVLSLTSAFALPAFPGAEGFGANATGGRGGSVYVVTNLNDSGTGSFRDAVGTANRTVVFAVGGIIRITSPVVVKNNVTIAGQTAPGGGITLYGNRISYSGASNSITRYLRIREGINGDSGTDAVGIASGTDMIFDHVSASWGRDETFSISGSAAQRITIQDSIIGQGLLIHSAGGLIQTDGGVSIFRTLYADNYMRNPKIKGVNDYINNVVYNWGSGGGYIPAGDSAGLTYANMIGCYFVSGPVTGSTRSPFSTGNENYHLFQDGNLEDTNLDGVLNGVAVSPSRFSTLTLVPTPYAYPAPATVLTAPQALQHIVNYAGASLVRDSVDAYIVNELLSYGTSGAHIYNESEVGGVGSLAGGLAPADTDGDGMPDWWEEAAGTNPGVADNNGDLDGDGYTNIENYINALAVTGVPGALISGIADDTGSSASDGVTSDSSLVLTGTATPGAVVQLHRIDTGLVGSTVASPSGSWTFDYSSTTLAPRHYAFFARTELPGGALSPSSPVFKVKIDQTPAATPVITSIVTSPAIAFNGTAEPYAQISVSLAGVGLVGTAQADGLGAWSATYAGAPLTAGVYSFTATATDLAGNEGAASNAYAIDTGLAAPVFTSVSDDTGSSTTDRITKDTTLVLAGSAPADSTVTVTRVGTGVIGSTAANASGLWTFSYTGTTLTSGQYTFIASATSGGNASAASAPFVVTVDTVAPTIASSSRYNPSTASTSASTLVYRVTWSEPVLNVDTGNFVLTVSGVTGAAISSVTPVSSSVYDVTVTGATGDGTLRLDRKASASVVDLAGNTVSSGTYTGGQTYTIRAPGSGVWLNGDGEGTWSDAANWDPGAGVASGATSTADFSSLDVADNQRVVLDGPRTVGRLVFGDADESTPGTWTLAHDGNAANTLTLASTGTPTIQVNYASPSGGTNPTFASTGAAYPATISAPLSAATLTKTGWGTAVLTNIGSIPGLITVSQGWLKIGAGATLVTSAVSTSTSAQFIVDGGNVTVTGDTNTVSGTGGGIVVNAGTGVFQKIIPTNARNGLVKVTGGSLTATELNFPRSGDSANQFTAGLVVEGGTAQIGTLGLGTVNSWGAASVSGGTLTVTGPFHIGYQQTSTRGGQMRVTGGRVISTETTKGIVLSRKNGSNANNVAELTLTGGTVVADRISLGYDSTVNAGSATILVGGGALYLGDGGLVKNGVSPFVATVTLESGVLGAVENWETTVPLSFNGVGTPSVRAADEAGTPFNITVGDGVLTGAGGFTKTGLGSLIVNGSQSLAGDITVSAGALQLNGVLSATSGVLRLGTGGVLSGAGTSNKVVVIDASGVLAPAGSGVGTLTVGGLSWAPGGRLAVDLGATSDLVAISAGGTLRREAGAGACQISVTPGADFGPGVYTLISYPAGAATGVSAADFTVSGVTGYATRITVGSTALTLMVDTPLGLWEREAGLSALQRGPGVDADGDGLVNALEFALGLSPVTPDGAGTESGRITVDGADYPTITFVRRQGLTDVTLSVRVSASLDFTGSLGAVEVSSTDLGNGTERVVTRSAVALAVQPRQFLRVEVAY